MAAVTTRRGGTAHSARPARAAGRLWGIPVGGSAAGVSRDGVHQATGGRAWCGWGAAAPALSPMREGALHRKMAAAEFSATSRGARRLVPGIRPTTRWQSVASTLSTVQREVEHDSLPCRRVYDPSFRIWNRFSARRFGRLCLCYSWLALCECPYVHYGLLRARSICLYVTYVYDMCVFRSGPRRRGVWVVVVGVALALALGMA
eukprot:scaffold3520_cov154-Isochrysis_galbana.AAC.2